MRPSDLPGGGALRAPGQGARRRRATLALLLWLPVWCAACSGDRPSAPLSRTGPLGSLRDLVLFQRRAEHGGPFFLDRFEVTRGDFAEFAATADGMRAGVPLDLLGPDLDADEVVLPMTRVDLPLARAFARWRRCRLPRSDEWLFACTTDGRDSFPWGSRPDAARANTNELGVYAALPVGTFESGRNGDGPYDLIGNVAEWTETVPGAWFFDLRHWLPPRATAYRRVMRSPGLTAWSPVPGVCSPLMLVAAAGDRAPREVLGADFASSMRDGPQLRAPRDCSDALGLRLCTTPSELLRALAPDLAGFDGEDLRQLQRFFGRPGHAEVLRASLPRVPMSEAARERFQALLP